MKMYFRLAVEVMIQQLPEDLIHLIGTFIDMEKINEEDARERYRRVCEREKTELSKEYHVNLWIPYATKITKKCIFVPYDNTRYRQNDPEIHNKLKMWIEGRWETRKEEMCELFINKYWTTQIEFIDLEGNIYLSPDTENYHRRSALWYLKPIDGLKQEGPLYLWKGEYRDYGKN